MNGLIQIHDDVNALGRAVADRWVGIAEQAIARRGRFHVALAGGSTPRTVYATLSSPDYRQQVDWARTHVFFGDERCVPPEDPASNYHMAREALLARVPIPETQIYRMAGEATDPHAAASDYERRLRRLLPRAGNLPQFDLVLLGMGEDGHTASLFPYSELLAEQHRAVAAAYIDQLDAWRITLTLPVINQAEHAVVMVAGRAKAHTVYEVLQGPARQPPYPIQMVHPPGGAQWHLDREAAAELSEEAQP